MSGELREVSFTGTCIITGRFTRARAHTHTNEQQVNYIFEVAMAVRIADENGTEPQSDRTAVKNVTCTGTGFKLPLRVLGILGVG